MFIFFTLSAYVLANLFFIKKGRKWLWHLSRISSDKRILNGITVLYIIIAAFPVLGTITGMGTLKPALLELGNLWLAFVFHVFMLTIIAMAVRMIVNGIRRKIFRAEIVAGTKPVLPKRNKIMAVTGIFIFIISLCLTVFGWQNAHDIETTAYDINANKNAGSTKQLTIAFVADLHIGGQVDWKMIEKMVEKINAINADVVIVGGDIFDSSYDTVEDADKIIRIMRKIESRYGVYGVYGNHDVKETLVGGFAISKIEEAFRDPRMEEFTENCGIEMLEDDIVTIADNEIYLIGRLDGEKSGDGTTDRKSEQELIEGIDTSKPIIVVQHEPSDLGVWAEYGADLILSGHTHAGQFFPGTAIMPLLWENYYGEWHQDNTYSLVTSGVGFYGPPIRLFTDSEVVKVTVNLKAEGE